MKRLIWGVVGLWCGCAAAQDNLVRNPGFEETGPSGATAGWTERPPVYRFEAGAGRGGTRGLAFNNSDPSFYSFPTQVLDVRPGRCYAFEGWVRTEGLRGEESGATFCLEWSGPDGKWLGGAYAEGVRGTSDGWRLVRGETQVLPTNAARVTVAAYVRRGMTGRAWFDDLRVTRHVPPLVSAVSASCYRGVAAGGPVTFSAGLALAEAGVSLGEVRGRFTVTSADGRAVLQAAPEELADDVARFALDAGALPVGEYVVSFELTGSDGAARGRAETRLSRVSELPRRRVSIDAGRRLIVDGRPFFPLGMYWSRVKEPELELYAKGPFNCLMPYGSPSPKEMDACQARGLKVIYSLKDLYAGTRWAPAHVTNEAAEAAEIQTRVAQHRGHPALLAWYINDELPLSLVDRLAARQRLLEELDPDHPTWVVLYQYRQVRAYLPTFDVIGTDPYPVPDKPAGTALEWTRVTRDQCYGQRALWQVPQVFDWGAYRKGPERAKTRAPTRAEMRSMAWQCVAAGANGLVFYSFFDLFKMQDRDPFDARWNDVCAVAEEVRRYLPVLLSDERAPGVSCAGAPQVEARAWRCGGDVYVLVVNGSSEAAQADVTVGGDCGQARAEFGAAPARAAGGAWSFRLAALEPVLVRLSK